MATSLSSLMKSVMPSSRPMNFLFYVTETCPSPEEHTKESPKKIFCVNIVLPWNSLFWVLSDLLCSGCMVRASSPCFLLRSSIELSPLELYFDSGLGIFSFRCPTLNPISLDAPGGILPWRIYPAHYPFFSIERFLISKSYNPRLLRRNTPSALVSDASTPFWRLSDSRSLSTCQ